MGDDEVVDNMGNRRSVFLPLHGKVGWTPASRVVLHSAADSLVLEGDIPEQNVFGVNYVLRTRLTLRHGSSSIEINDSLCNLGAVPGEYEMLYHTNFGPPFLEEGARFFGTYNRVIPRDDFAAAGLDDMLRFAGPTAGFAEQVFLFRAGRRLIGTRSSGPVQRRGKPCGPRELFHRHSALCNPLETHGSG